MAAFLERFMEKVRGYDSEDEYDEYEEFDESQDQDEEINVPVEHKSGFFKRQSKVVDFNKSSSHGQQVVIIQPSCIESAQEVCNHLRQGRTVICNFETIEPKVAQRVMDFITGATYAIDGQVHKVSPMIFVTVPRNISLMDENNPMGMEYLKNKKEYAAR